MVSKSVDKSVNSESDFQKSLKKTDYNCGFWHLAKLIWHHSGLIQISSFFGKNSLKPLYCHSFKGDSSFQYFPVQLRRIPI